MIQATANGLDSGRGVWYNTCTPDTQPYAETGRFFCAENLHYHNLIKFLFKEASCYWAAIAPLRFCVSGDHNQPVVGRFFVLPGVLR